MKERLVAWLVVVGIVVIVVIFFLLVLLVLFSGNWPVDDSMLFEVWRLV